MKTKKYKTPVQAPNLEELTGLFDSPESMVLNIDSICNLLSKFYKQEAMGDSASVLEFIMEQVQVEFSHEVSEVVVEAKFRKQFLLVKAPVIDGESPAHQDSRRIELLKTFWPTLQDAKLRVVAQLVQFLDHTGKTKLKEKYSSHE